MKRNEGQQKLYYISAEFLIGKLLSNNLINLGLFDETREVLKRYDKEITEIEEVEPEPSHWEWRARAFSGLLSGFHRHPGTSGRRRRIKLP